jgi:TolB-like protein/Tfp pilus assembly protein PilF
MMTGRQAFSGSTSAAIFDAILHKAPTPPAQYNAGLPSKIEEIITRALEKDRQLRYQTAGGILADLKRLKRDLDSSSGTVAGAKGGNPEEEMNAIAVLPFENSSGDPDSEYLSDGIAESLINSLSQLGRLRVLARGTVFRYKGQTGDPQRLGRELNVRAVLTGRVLQRGGTLVIGTELTDVRNGWQLWGERYKRQLDDIFDVQEEIAKVIFDKLKVRLSPTEEKKLAERHTESPEAYELYLKARHSGLKMTRQELHKALDYCRRAIEIDPAFAAAHAWIAWGYVGLGLFGFLPTSEATYNAKSAATKALTISPDMADAHAALAFVYVTEWEWGEADRETRRAVELDPNSDFALWASSQLAMYVGDLEKALRQSERALELSPLNLMSIYSRALALFYGRRYDEAMKVLQRCLEIEPEFSLAHLILSYCYAIGQLPEKAFEEIEKAAGLGIPAEAGRGLVFALMGKSEEARHELEQFKSGPVTGITMFFLGWAYAALGDKDEAMRWLEDAYQQRFSLLMTVGIRPGMEALSSDLRFQDLLRRIGLAH